MRDRALRDHLARMLDWEEPTSVRQGGRRHSCRQARRSRSRLEHSPWQLLEHLRLARTTSHFCLNASYVHTMTWPDDYWPGHSPADDAAWKASIAAFARSRNAMKDLARDVEDLTATVPTGKGNQTYLRAILLVADHTAYHVGQLVAVRRALGIWK
jgi:hypothetical protein